MSLKCKNSKHGGQAIILLNWLFQDELNFVPVAEALASIITRKNDHDLLFGWCLLLRSIVDYDSSVHQSMLSGIRERYSDFLKILSTCLHDLAGIVSNESTLQDGFELPSRFGVSAADCFLAISGALTKADKLQDKKLTFNAKAKDQEITLVQCPIFDKNVKSDSKSLLMSKFERDYTLWHHIDDLICLAQRLLSIQMLLRPGFTTLFLLEALLRAITLGRSEIFSALQGTVGPIFVRNPDPSLYLLDLVRNVYSPDENQSSASDAIIGVLKRHNQNIDDIIFLLLDCLNNISQNLDDPPDAKMIYPSLYLLDLVRNVYSPDENQSSASDAIIGVLKRHNQNIDDIIFLLLDCLNNICQNLDDPPDAKMICALWKF
ncbi:hypothetical protein QL285_088437 [Trifolium repens]|nr:hypothetical protein QL285_088437 [Trifolium repens]